jgi:hypothetical protein
MGLSSPILMLVSFHSVILWVVTLCSLSAYQHTLSIFIVAFLMGGRIFLQNLDTHLPNYTTSQSRIPETLIA